MLSKQKIRKLLKTAKRANNPSTAQVWARTVLESRIRHAETTPEKAKTYQDMLDNPTKYNIKIV